MPGRTAHEEHLDCGGRSPARRRVVLTGISSRAWEHPADRGALTALRELRGFDDVVKAFFGMWNERAFRLSFLACAHPGRPPAVPAGPPALRRSGRDPRPARAARALRRPVAAPDAPRRSAWTGRSSWSTPPCVQQLDDDELRCLLGHELGHVGSGHAVYKTILMILTRLGGQPELAAGRRDRAARASSRRCSSGGARPNSPPTGPACSPGRTRPPRCGC